jgi:hypothetical protein
MWSKAAIAAAGLTASLGIGGAAYAATVGSPSHATSTTAVSSQSVNGGTAAGGGRAKAKGLHGRADHITLEVRAKGKWVTYDMDRGKVTAVSPTSITLLRPDGQSVTEAIDAHTKFKGAASEADIQTGRPALVVSEGGTAVRIRQGAGTGSGGTGGAGSAGTGGAGSAGTGGTAGAGSAGTGGTGGTGGTAGTAAATVGGSVI